jgi:hypothetical protein
MSTFRRLVIPSLAALSSTLHPALAQPAGDENRAHELQGRAIKAVESGDAAGAEALFREELALDPGNSIIYYNIACTRSLQHDGAGAMDWLVRSIERGYVDLPQIQRDPQLADARRDPRFARLESNWGAILQRNIDANLKATRGAFTQGTYAESRDERLRLAFLSAMDETSTTQAHQELTRLHAWAMANVFTDLADPAGEARDAWTVVVLPSPKDFLRWVVSNYGAPAIGSLTGIGGAYMHDEKRLVAQDLGATLRHEFFHVLHWRSMTRLGQAHPIWIQEGLCSLVEDYAIDKDGSPASLHPVPSWRTNIGARLLRSGSLMRIDQLAKESRERFSGTNPLAHYGQARGVFLFLWDKGKLKDWYEHYTRHYSDDPSGIKAIEAVFGKDINTIEKDYRAWVKALPEVAEQIRPGEATLGVDVDAGAGDGPVIVSIPRLSKNGVPPARLAGLAVGDVITAINGQPTRDLNELVRVLGAMKIGETVEVEYRRRSTRGSAKITLVARSDD